MGNEKIRTPDVVEVLDAKILTSTGHPAIGVLARESYDSVLTKIGLQSLSPAEKQAFDATLTAPGPSNPVVLRDDLATYIPAADLGSVRDTVATSGQLPLPIALTGNLSVGSVYCYALSTTSGYGPGDTIQGPGIAASTTVVVVQGSQLQMTAPSTALTIGAALTIGPTPGDLRAVTADGIIYRWNGSAWLQFIRTGTLDHTLLNNVNGDPNYQHVTQAQKTLLLAQTHIHANEAVLDAILSAGSGAIITAAERSWLPTGDQKDALIGTAGTPGATDPYVTNLDPRLNTVRNPYVTVGPPGSLASFSGVDFRPFDDALQAIDIGTASAVKGIEVLPGTYTMGGASLRWTTQGSALLIEALVPGTVVLAFQTLTTAGIQGLLPGTGQLTLRGLTLQLNDNGTSGILSQRPNTIIENCTFVPGPTIGINQVAVTLAGANSVVRHCQFTGTLAKGVVVTAPGCRVEECTFNLSLPTATAVQFQTGADGSIVDHCSVVVGRLVVDSAVPYCQVANNYLGPTSTIVDLGSSTRILQNQPEEFNQPFVARRRTVGPVGTYADYRGSTDTPIAAALADPLVDEVEFLPGTYTLAATLTVPAGKRLRAPDPSQVTLVGPPGAPAVQLLSFCGLDGLTVQGSGASLVVVDQGLTVTPGVQIRGCVLDLVAQGGPTDAALYGHAVSDLQVLRCQFPGVAGLSLAQDQRSLVQNNVLATSGLPSTCTGSSLGRWCDNYFTATTAPVFGGDILMVEGNHFLGGLPTKLGTTDSTWQANYPHPRANNQDSVWNVGAAADNLDLSLDRFLRPLQGAVRAELAGLGTIQFPDSAVTSAAVVPVALSSRLNRNLGFQVSLYWTSPVLTGSVVWRVTVTFRGAGTIGTSVTLAAVSPRTQGSVQQEEVVVYPFTNLNYGLPLLVDPTSVSLLVERVGTDPADTLAGYGYLVDVRIQLPRD